MSTTGEAGRLAKGPAHGDARISLQAIVEAARRLDELSTARLVGSAATAVHAAQKGGVSIGIVSPAAILVAADGSVSLGSGAAVARYTAPEQLRGGAGDRRSDVFALGVVLWEALAHEALFAGASDDEVKRAVAEREVRPPSELNANVPAELDVICKKALARDPADRYQSARVMAAELDAVLDDAGYPETNEEIAKFVANLPAPVAVAAAPAAVPAPKAPVIPSVMRSTTIGVAVQPPPEVSSKATVIGVAPIKDPGLKATQILGTIGSVPPANVVASAPAIEPPKVAEVVAPPKVAEPPKAVAPPPKPAEPPKPSKAEAKAAKRAKTEPIIIDPSKVDGKAGTLPGMPEPKPPGNTSPPISTTATPTPTPSTAPPAMPAPQPDAPKPSLRETAMFGSGATPQPVIPDAPPAIVPAPPVLPSSKSGPAGKSGKFAAAVVPLSTAETVQTPLLGTIPGGTVAPTSAPAALVTSDVQIGNPVDAVSLPAPATATASETGAHDVLKGWGWSTDSHAALTDDEDVHADGERTQRKRLVYAIGGGVAVVALIIIVAFAFRSSPKPSPDDKSAAKPVVATEPPKPPAAIGEPGSDQPAVAPTGSDQPAPTPTPTPAVEPPKVEPPPPAPPPAVEPPKVEPPKVEPPPPAPPKVEPPPPTPPKVEPPKIAKVEPPAPKHVDPPPAPKHVDPPPAPKHPKVVPAAHPIDPYAAATPPAPKADPVVAYRTGLQQFARGDTTAALGTLKTSASASPGFAPTWRGLGLVYEKLGQKGAARAAFKRYLGLAPHADDADQIRDRMEHL